MASATVVPGFNINLDRRQEQVWWFTHSLFNRSHSVVPAISIVDSTSSSWDEDGFFGVISAADVVSFWIEHFPTLIDFNGRPVVRPRPGNTILVHFRNRSGNPITIKPRFIVASD